MTIRLAAPSTIAPALGAAIDRFVDWYANSALPLWARAAADPSGAFHETLDFAGRPVAGVKRRVRVQCRQAHAFTKAALLGWLSEGEAIASRGFARLVETACPDEAERGCAHLVDANGAIIDGKRDLYDQAFLLLACAARIEAANDTRAFTVAERTLAFLDRELASPHGGYREDDLGSLPRRQNPHMHLFEATMALHAATKDPAHLSLARAIESLFSSRFLDRKCKVLREFFNEDWSLDAARGDIVEPGHMAEWVFLLDRFETLTGEDRAGVKRLLFKAAAASVAPGDEPFVPNAAKAGAAPRRGARRLWPQTEALRAALVLAREGDGAAAARAAALIDALFDTYLDAETPGLWRDEYDADGRPVAKDVPASILYHLHEAASCAQAIRRGHAP